MHVKNMMVLTKLCLILVCSNNAFAESFSSVSCTKQVATVSATDFLFNMSRCMKTRLKDEDHKLHNQAIHFALNNADNGELVEWINERTDAQGKARIVYTWMGSGNVCRRVHSWVRYGIDEKTYEDTACQDPGKQTWQFVDKY